MLSGNKFYDAICGDEITLRVYADSRPHVLKIADLQKGLILVINGKENVEEGIGFGVPVVRYGDRLYFSKSAQVSIYEEKDSTIIIKSFRMDSVPKRSLTRKVLIDPFPKVIRELIERSYRERKLFRIILKQVLRVRKLLGIHTRFVNANPQGSVTVTYRIFSDKIQISVDFTKLRKNGCTDIFILNEQGSSLFRRYQDSNGLVLYDNKIGVWDEVEADKAWISDLLNTLRFSFGKQNESIMFRGRESLEGMLAWAGIDYRLKSNMMLGSFKYQIEIDEEAKG